jgi:TRAP-type C4-dicarboxylate transport system permease large subunit
VKLRKELWFGFSLMAVIVITILVFMPWGNITNGHLGLLMLALIVVAIMLGFPTAFTLMGMGVFFAWLAYETVNPKLAVQQVLDLFVQRTYGVMSNDVLIAIPLFLFMGYLVERAKLIDRLFHSLHLATTRVPGSLAVATIVTCAIFATATGIVGACVTLMGLLAFPAMLKAGYNVKIAAGAVTAGGCLGILIPPSVLLIVYGRLPAFRSSTLAPSCPASCSLGSTLLTSSSSRRGSLSSCHHSPRANGAWSFRPWHGRRRGMATTR